MLTINRYTRAFSKLSISRGARAICMIPPSFFPSPRAHRPKQTQAHDDESNAIPRRHEKIILVESISGRERRWHINFVTPDSYTRLEFFTFYGAGYPVYTYKLWFFMPVSRNGGRFCMFHIRFVRKHSRAGLIIEFGWSRENICCTVGWKVWLLCIKISGTKIYRNIYLWRIII